MSNRAVYISLTVFVLSATFWIYSYNRYSILSFAEERQLYQTGLSYFCRHIEQPGGLIRYLSAFLTQFNRYFLLGAAILSLSVGAVYGMFIAAGGKHFGNGRFFVLPFVVPLGLLFAASDYMLFGSAQILGILLALSAFGLYLRLENDRKRLSVGVLLCAAVYFVAGGNVFLFAALVFAGEAGEMKRSGAALIRATTVGVLSVLIPLVARRYVYLAPSEAAYFALTPFDYRGSVNGFYRFAWLSVPAIYFAGRIFDRARSRFKFRTVVVLRILCACLLVGFVGAAVARTANPTGEKIMRMAYNVEHGNWDATLADGFAKDAPDWAAPPIAYFTDIALSEKGRLASDMFRYRQTGLYGLFLAWESDYRIYLYTGELYHRLGMAQEARHCAFEASVAGGGSKAMKRLVLTAMTTRDVPMFEKFIRMFERSPVYAAWATERREEFGALLADSTYRVPGMPETLTVADFAMNYNRPAETQANLMKTNPGNKKVFERLIACCLLEKNMEAFLDVMEKHWQEMDYDTIPRHIEEALLICENLMRGREDILQKYNVRVNTKARIFALNKSLKTMSDRELQKEYGDTYTYYFLKIKPLLLDEIYNSVY